MGDDEEVLFGELVVFEVSADASGFGDDLKCLGDAEDAVVHRRTHGGVLLFLGGIEAASGPDEDAAGREGGAELFQDVFMALQWHVPDAVPGGDEVILLVWLPGADVSVVEGDAWMACPGEGDHLRGDIESFDLVAVGGEQVDEAAVAPATDIEGQAATFADF